MPAFLYSRQGISSPANAEGIPEHFLCAYKRGWLPGIRQKGAAGLSADIPARQVWPHGQTFPKPAARLAANRMVHPLARRRAATAFFRREKGSKTRRSPAPNGLRLTVSPTAPNRLRGNLFLLMWPGCGRMVFMLTRAAGAYLRPGPIYPHQIVPGQNVPYIPLCGRTRKPEASRRFAVHANRGVEIACDFVCRENTSGKSNFCVLLFADKRTWLPGIRQKGADDAPADKLSNIFSCHRVSPGIKLNFTSI